MNIAEQLVANFLQWEQRGRGSELYPEAVELEPPFKPFPGHRLRFENAKQDSGTKSTFLSRLAAKAFKALQPPAQGSGLAATPADEDAEPLPEPYEFGEEPIEVQVSLPPDVSVSSEQMAQFFTTLSLATGVMGLEIIATAETVLVQLICRVEDADALMAQVEAQFPDAEITWSRDALREAWTSQEEQEPLVLEFGLYQPFMRPLATGGRSEPYVSLVGGMAKLSEGETAVYQVLFTPLRAPWKDQMLAAVTKADGKPFFDDGAELVKETREKVSRPLYGVVLRLAATSANLPRSWEIIRGMAPALRLYSRDGGQSLMPLPNAGYDDAEHEADLLWRRSRRCGMILNLEELSALAHWPSPAVQCAKLVRKKDETTRAAPELDGRNALLLGVNEHGSEVAEVYLPEAQRLQHMHVIGGSGTGKSTLLLSLILQDLECGRGFCLLDPHGDLIDRTLASIPDWRMDDVVLIDPSDEQHIVPFNVLSAHSDNEKALLASDLVSVFKRQSTSWGDRMGIIFQNAVLAFLEHPDGGTLADMRRFLVDEKWRASFLAGVTDPDVQFYWTQTFPKLDGPKSIGPILTRLETLLTPKVIRYMVSQRQNLIDFTEIMDEGRILLVRLPQGQIGKENAFMLGSLIMVKLQQMVMGRARMSAAERRPFFCYVDECQHFITPSMAEILSGARKYGLGLVLAHQDLHQLSQSPDVAAAVMTNAATRIVFRVSESDGRSLKGDFAHYEPKDFASLATGEALCRIGRADQDFNLRVLRPDDPDEEEATARREQAIEESRSRYTVPRSEVEEEIRRQLTDQAGATAAAKAKPAKAQPGREPCEPAGVPEPTAGDVDSLLPSSAVDEPASTPATPVVPAGHTPVERGKGGVEHRAIQSRIRAAAEKLGFRAEIEAQVGDGHASVDVLVRRDSLAIACEISISTPAAHELENLKKCLAGEFSRVVMLSENASFIAKLRQMAEVALQPGELENVAFYSPDEFIGYLESIETQAAATGEKRVRGFKVTRTFVPMSPSERRAFSEKALQLLAEEMKQPPPKV